MTVWLPGFEPRLPGSEAHLPGSEPLWRAAVVDPPWEERGGGGRGAQKHYKLLKAEEVPGVLRASGGWRPHQNAHLYLWVTDTFLPEGIWLMGEMGFRYTRTWVWVKPGIGIGQYARGQHELMLFGVKGRGKASDVMTERKNISSVIQADYVRDARGRRIHSAKPPESYAVVEARSRGPYGEFFCRGPGRPGWSVFGDEAVQAPADVVTSGKPQGQSAVADGRGRL